jgi:hypothetical protein
MMYLIYILFIIFVVMVLLFSGNRSSSRSSEGNSSTLAASSVQAAGINPPVTSMLTREEVQNRLMKLSKSPPPADLKMGATCYRVAIPPNRGEFVCAKCGERTLYSSDSKDGRTNGWLISSELPECRRRLKEIRGLDLKLDETEFCKKCSPSSKSPQLILITKYRGDDQVHRFKGISSEDLTVLKEFLDGSDRHLSRTDTETPLSGYSARLSKILDLNR